MWRQVKISVLMIMRVNLSSSLAFVLILFANTIKIIAGRNVCQNGDITNIERRIGLCGNDSTLLGVVTVTATANISCKCSQKGDTDILAIISGMFGGISCFSDRLPSLQANDGSNCTSMSETCYSNQTLHVASKSSSVGIGLGEVSMLTIILGSLLGATTLLLVATTIALICFIAANLKLKKKVKQFARSHSRLNKHKKEEHLIHNPVYCETQLKEPQNSKRVYLSSLTREGQYSLAGPGMPYEITEIDDF